MPSPMTLMKNGLRNSPFRRAVMSYRHQQLLDSDVFLASYPRSGNTWMKSLLASCLFGKAMQNFSDTVDPVIPIVGYHRNVKPLLSNNGRIIKTHESYRSEYRNAVWIVRDPRDVVLSEYKLHLRSGTFTRTFDEYVAYFTSVRHFGPPDWQSHTSSWLNSGLADSTKLLVIRFEDLKADPATELRRVLLFMGLPVNDDLIATALQQNTLQSMAQRHVRYDETLGKQIKTEVPAVNQGQVGGWRSKLTSQQVDLIEERFQPVMEQLSYERKAL